MLVYSFPAYMYIYFTLFLTVAAVVQRFMYYKSSMRQSSKTLAIYTRSATGKGTLKPLGAAPKHTHTQTQGRTKGSRLVGRNSRSPLLRRTSRLPKDERFGGKTSIPPGTFHSATGKFLVFRLSTLSLAWCVCVCCAVLCFLF